MGFLSRPIYAGDLFGVAHEENTANGLLLRLRFQQYDWNGSGQRIIARINANGQTAPGWMGLMVPRAHLHHIKRWLGRAPVNFIQGIRLLQEFQHFNLGGHTLSGILSAVNMPSQNGRLEVFRPQISSQKWCWHGNSFRRLDAFSDTTAHHCFVTSRRTRPDKNCPCKTIGASCRFPRISF